MWVIAVNRLQMRSEDRVLTCVYECVFEDLGNRISMLVLVCVCSCLHTKLQVSFSKHPILVRVSLLFSYSTWSCGCN